VYKLLDVQRSTPPSVSIQWRRQQQLPVVFPFALGNDSQLSSGFKLRHLHHFRCFKKISNLSFFVLLSSTLAWGY